MKIGTKLVNITVLVDKSGWTWSYSEVEVTGGFSNKLRITRLSGDRAGTSYLTNKNNIGVISLASGRDNYYQAGQKVLCGKVDVGAYKILLAKRIQDDIKNRLDALKELPMVMINWKNKN